MASRITVTIFCDFAECGKNTRVFWNPDITGQPPCMSFAGLREDWLIVFRGDKEVSYFCPKHKAKFV